MEQYFEESLLRISKEKNKICTLLGDYNVELSQVGSHSDTWDLYDLLSANGFKPLIMQSTRVTSKPAILIDNIFVNDIETRPTGGNIITSISDHFPQFCMLNIFQQEVKKTIW